MDLGTVRAHHPTLLLGKPDKHAMASAPPVEALHWPFR